MVGFMTLQRNVRQAHKSAGTVFATVEDMTFGYATVRLVANGARLRHLQVIGKKPEVGDLVIVDYASGVPPKVRPPYNYPQVEEVYSEKIRTMAAPTPEGGIPVNNYMPGVLNYGCRVRRNAALQLLNVPVGWVTVPFDVADYDTSQYWDDQDPDHITVTVRGGYLVTALMGGNVEMQCGLGYHCRIHTNGQYPVCEASEPTLEYTEGVDKSIEMTGVLLADLGDIVKLQFKIDLPKSNLNVAVDTTTDMYPSLSIQWLGFIE